MYDLSFQIGDCTAGAGRSVRAAGVARAAAPESFVAKHGEGTAVVCGGVATSSVMQSTRPKMNGGG